MKVNNIVFMGTPDFAVPCLAALHEKYNVTAVITQPDKPKGRGQHMQKSPVKLYAEEHNIPVYQPVKVRDEEFVAKLQEINPDLIVVVAFGQILPESILNMPKYGCINVHGSILPRWRGAAPIHWSVIAGDKQTGVTTMYMDKGLDTGDMILKSYIEITPEMTTAQLHDKMMEVGAATLIDTLAQLEAGTAPRIPQPEEGSTYAVMLNKENSRIDWHKTAKEVHDLVRGLNSWPVAYTEFNEKKFKVWETKLAEGKGKPGEIIDCSKNGIVVACGTGAVLLTVIQPPNKAKMAAGSYVNGHLEELKQAGFFR